MPAVDPVRDGVAPDRRHLSGPVSRALTVRRHAWPIRGSFTISRGSKTSADTLIVEITDGDAVGRGECVPYARYGETMESAEAQVRSVTAAVDDGADRSDLLDLLPACAARNAVDCALWDLAAKRSGRPAWQLARLAAPKPVETAYTISLDTVDAMGRAAAKASAMPLLKLKLTGEGRYRARRGRSGECTGRAHRRRCQRGLDRASSRWVRPGPGVAGRRDDRTALPAGKDDALAGYDGPITLCADESCHDRSSLDDLAGKYGMVNIKLDKTGGLTEALALREQARGTGLSGHGRLHAGQFSGDGAGPVAGARRGGGGSRRSRCGWRRITNRPCAPMVPCCIRRSRRSGAKSLYRNCLRSASPPGPRVLGAVAPAMLEASSSRRDATNRGPGSDPKGRLIKPLGLRRPSLAMLPASRRDALLAKTLIRRCRP